MSLDHPSHARASIIRSHASTRGQARIRSNQPWPRVSLPRLAAARRARLRPGQPARCCRRRGSLSRGSGPRAGVQADSGTDSTVRRARDDLKVVVAPGEGGAAVEVDREVWWTSTYLIPGATKALVECLADSGCNPAEARCGWKSPEERRLSTVNGRSLAG